MLLFGLGIRVVYLLQALQDTPDLGWKIVDHIDEVPASVSQAVGEDYADTKSLS